MPRILKPSEVIEGKYRIEQEVNRGMFAISYRAVRLSDNKPAFFKNYLTPTTQKPWFQAYVDQVRLLRERIQGTPATKNACYEIYDLFTHGPSLCMAFEWAQGGLDLKAKLEAKSLSWDTKVLYAKLMLFGVRQLHNVKIVHCDLKPENLLLIPNPSIAMGYNLRVIDMDQSILSDRQAAWHGTQTGYAGTMNYLSPEHVRHAGDKRIVPTEASDAFTCGVMLSEILGDGNPFLKSDDYMKAVLAPLTRKVKLRGSFGSADRDREMEDMIHASLSSDPAKRPTVAQMHGKLMGVSPFVAGPVRPIEPPPVVHDGKIVPPPVPSVIPPVFPPAIPPAIPPATSSGTKLQFVSAAGTSGVLQITTDLELGKSNFAALSENAKFLDPQHFRVQRAKEGWTISPNPTTSNQLFLDEAPVMAPMPLRTGMQLSVGSRDPSKPARKPLAKVRILP